MYADLVALHMGALHPYEKVLTLVLAFGPFVVLGFVVHHSRKRALEEEQEQEQPVLGDDST